MDSVFTYAGRGMGDDTAKCPHERQLRGRKADEICLDGETRIKVIVIFNSHSKNQEHIFVMKTLINLDAAFSYAHNL